MSMKASEADQLALLRLQEHDNHIAHLGRQLESIAQQAELSEVITRIHEFSQVELARHQDLEEVKRDLARIEADVQLVDDRIAKDKAREEQNLSAKDVQAVESELATLALRKNELEETELLIMQAVEDAERAVEALAGEHEHLSAERSRLELAVKAEHARLEAEREAEVNSRAQLADSLPTELVALYENQRSRYGVGAAALEHRISGGSGMELTPTEVARIRATDAEEVVLCPDSNCILVRTNDSW